MRSILLSLMIGAALLVPAASAPAQILDHDPEVARLQREIEQLEAEIETLTANLKLLKERLAKAHAGGGYLRFPVNVERAMIGEGYLRIERQPSRAVIQRGSVVPAPRR